MRLTLRTLLSYLDDMLEPAQAKAIGAKVAESETARDLIERIKQVTRRRRLTSPPTSGPGGMDANNIAEYLDNEVTPEKAAEVENIFLASDVHLAEVAACHQILTLVLGEPALVPPSAKQRMYGLVKGPESIPFRKPAKAASKDDNDLSSEIEPDHDETLRLGVPAVGGQGSQRNFLLLIGGGVLAACLLAVAIWQFTRPADNGVPKPNGNNPIAQGNKDDKKKDDKKDEEIKKKETEKKDKDENPPPDKKGNESKKPTQPMVVTVKVEPAPEIPYQPANWKQQPVGKYVAPGIKQPDVFLQAKNEKATGWERIADADAPVSSGKPILSLPGSKSVVQLDTGIELTLWGNLPEETQDGLTYESRAVLHAPGQLDADLTLERGRIILRNKKGAKDGYVRVRFNNPTLGQEEHLDILLEGSDAAVIVERMCQLDREEPFFEDPMDKARIGPMATIQVFAHEQTANVRSAGVAFQVDMTSRPMLTWRSRIGVLGPPEKEMLPPWFNGMPKAKEEAQKLARDKALAAHKALATAMTKKPIDVALAEIAQAVQAKAEKEILASKQISPDTYALWQHVFRSSAAVDELGYLFEEFSKERTFAFVRYLCLETIQRWLTWDRDRDYVLLDIVRKNYRKTESIKMMELFHFISTADARKPATYQRLIEGLNNDILAIRMLSHVHLSGLVPAGASIPYDPAMPPPQREGAVRAWSQLIPPGQLPPPPGAPPKKKDKE